ncbi:hypothetical protein [Paraburkholderia phosphatilytica]|uniref:hypothetical protein n=1 Tax=Paraburkholderia phosphatilytica TaxID=2282883 RepID=UPI000E4C80CD|nr:hypothetical protein [Paraburkholderia phosphatilytica]
MSTYPFVDHYTKADDATNERARTDDHEQSDTPYLCALKAPTSLLVGSSSDRPDVATVAILGYN